MQARTIDTEEHELPSVEAVLAGTLALMTGYSQALQAALNPQHRVHMGHKIGANLALLEEHPLLSANFQHLLGGLRRRWLLMSACTEEAAPPLRGPTPSSQPAKRELDDPARAFQFVAPRRLQ